MRAVTALTLTQTMEQNVDNTQTGYPSKLDKALDILDASSAAFNFLAAILGPLAMLYAYRKANQSNVQTAQVSTSSFPTSDSVVTASTSTPWPAVGDTTAGRQ